MGLSNILKRTGRTAIEVAKSPWYLAKDVGEGLYQDLVLVKRSGLPAYAVGGAISLATLPFRRIIIPATLAGRAAKHCKSPKGVAVAGFIGGLAGAGLVAFAGELAILLYIVEAMTLAANADTRAKEKCKSSENKRKATVQTSPDAVLTVS